MCVQALVPEIVNCKGERMTTPFCLRMFACDKPLLECGDLTPLSYSVACDLCPEQVGAGRVWHGDDILGECRSFKFILHTWCALWGPKNYLSKKNFFQRAVKSVIRPISLTRCETFASDVNQSHSSAILNQQPLKSFGWKRHDQFEREIALDKLVAICSRDWLFWLDLPCCCQQKAHFG